MRMDTDTPLIPELVAESVAIDPAFITYASARAQQLFQSHPQFRQGCCRVDGNQYLSMFMQHWYTAWVQKGGVK